MKINYLLLTYMVVSCVFMACNKPEKEEEIASDTTKAFPQAEGAGQYATGGRDGTLFFVSNLEDNATKPGTLRYALNQPGAKTILFRVSGTIELQSELRIRVGNVTIAGQSAPGDGICIKNYPVVIDADNVIIRFIRFRMGDEKAIEGDALTCIRRHNIIIDHCSMSWGTDECASCYDNQNFTMQYCIISESLRNSVHGKGAHGYGGIWGGQNVSFLNNLLAHHDSRNPRFCGSRYTNRPDLEKVDFSNNVIYNWQGNSGYAGEGGSYNIVNNYYKPGPATQMRGGSRLYRIFMPNADNGLNQQSEGVWGSFYADGNHMYGNEAVTENNWNGGIQPNPTSKNIEELRAVAPFDFATTTTLSALDAYDQVLAKAGASLMRDVIDTRIVDEVRNASWTYSGSNGSSHGIIDSQSDVDGWPVYATLEPPKDTDGDGIPDAWEDEHGLDKSSSRDGKLKTLSAGYSNLEVYLNSLVKHLY